MRRGEVIADVYSFAIPPGLASGEYALDIGLYEASQGRRLNLPELAADRLRLGRVRVAAP